MRYLYRTAAVIVAILPLIREVEPFGEPRIYEYVNYLQYQDIAKAFNTSDFFWLYRFNYEVENIAKKSCVYIQISRRYQGGIDFEKGFIENNTSDTVDYSGKFYATHIIGMDDRIVEERNISNALLTTTNAEGVAKSANYSLLFSDYRDCLILLVLDNRIYDGYGCAALLTDSAARKGMNHTKPRNTWTKCENMFFNACAKHKENKKILFNNTCHS
uniref:Putative lipocalin-2 1 n=1 Tax=Amblyomma parvum TaxID=251391 RepID=A0A023G185_AMBPA